MGHITQIPLERLFIGETGLTQDKLNRILHAQKSGIILPPIPVKQVRDQYIFLDGRHRVFSEYFRGNSHIVAYVAQDMTDAMPIDLVKPELVTNIHETNKMIKFRWHSVEQIAKDTRVNYPTYAKLLINLPWLGNKPFEEYYDNICVHNTYPVKLRR